jgi:hypothetical protein
MDERGTVKRGTGGSRWLFKPQRGEGGGGNGGGGQLSAAWGQENKGEGGGAVAQTGENGGVQ